MAKKGRPGVTYQQFVKLWEQLLQEQRATTRLACEMLGSSSATITGYRERYESDKETQALDLIKQIELPEALAGAIAAIKVKEIALLEKSRHLIETRASESLQLLEAAEAKLAETQAQLKELTNDFDEKTLAFERQLAASQARIDDLLQREQQADQRYQQLNELYTQAKQERAVAKKEIELLREREAVS